MSHSSVRQYHNRRGMAIPEWFCILGLVAVGSMVLWTTFGESVNQYTDTTASSVADPSTLRDHPAFGPCGPGEDDGSPNPHGNNGVGNGEDPQPSGNPPVNDGPGTGPGNPGNRGGAHR